MKKTISNFANNQVLISYKDDNGAFNSDTEFHSYGTKIAETKGSKIFLDSKFWNYSNTTIKYLCKYLGFSSKKNVEDGIKNGIFTLTNLQ
jgi:hypothetical protein